MKTILRTGEFKTNRAVKTCAMISLTVSDLKRPILPVSQKVHPILQPT